MNLNTELLQRNPREVLAAANDVARAALGLNPLNPHPLASTLTLDDVAFAMAIRIKPQAPHEVDRSVVARGMDTADFKRLLESNSGIVVERRYSQAADHLAFALPIPARDFKPFALPNVDAEALKLEPTEGDRLIRGTIDTPAGAAAAVLQTFGKAVTITRRAIVDGAMAAMETIASGAGVNVARLEGRLVADALENPGKLDDDGDVFHADHGNIVALALDASNLGTGMHALRTQRTSAGELADVAARHLVVEPALELLARKLVHEAGMGEMISVHVLASLPTGRWYLLGDPALQPAVGVLRLEGARAPATIEMVKAPKNIEGLAMRVIVDAGACMLARVGIVRGGI